MNKCPKCGQPVESDGVLEPGDTCGHCHYKIPGEKKPRPIPPEEKPPENKPQEPKKKPKRGNWGDFGTGRK